MRKKRVVLMSDMHCGHRAGLTPPRYQLRPAIADTAANEKRTKWVEMQGLQWAAFARKAKSIQPVDIVCVVGDGIDGDGWRSGGTELITTDREVQTNMAVLCIDEFKAKKKVVIYGTAYHGGQAEDWEDLVADKINAVKRGSHEWIDVNGLIIDLKHHVGASETPHTQGSALSRDGVWNALWAARDEQPLADVIVRAHVHSYLQIGTADKTLLTLPALQGAGTKFGARKCSRTVDWGFCWMDVWSKDEFRIESEITRFKSQKPEAIKL